MKRLAILAALLATPALAQQPTPSEQALTDRLLAEIQSNLQARAQVIDLQRQLSAAQAKVKELEAKQPPEDKAK